MTKKQLKSNRSGFVLLLVVVMVVLLFIIGLGLLRLGLSARMQASRTSAGISARTAADAGLISAVQVMMKKMISEPTWDNSTLPVATNVDLPNSYASYSFNTTGDPCNDFQITSTGKSGVAEEIVYSKVIVQSAFVGIAVKEDIDVRVDAQFGTIPADSNFVLRTDSTEDGAITLKSRIFIPGDVIVGPGGDPDTVINKHDTVVIEGDVYAAPVEIYYPPVIPPAFPGGPDVDIEVRGGGEPLTITESGRYGSITVKPNVSGTPAILEIAGGDVVLYATGDVSIANGCYIKIKYGSSLELYLGGNLSVENSGGIVHEGITSGSPLEDIAEAAMNLKIYGMDSCTLIQLKANSAPFYGAMYAPNANLQLYNSGDLAGAFVGRSVRMFNSSGVFYYIPALGQVGINDQTAYLAVVRWWE